MDVYNIISSIIENPEAVQFYRDLKNHYELNSLPTEAFAIGYLLERKFENLNEIATDNPSDYQKP